MTNQNVLDLQQGLNQVKNLNGIALIITGELK